MKTSNARKIEPIELNVESANTAPPKPQPSTARFLTFALGALLIAILLFQFQGSRAVNPTTTGVGSGAVIGVQAGIEAGGSVRERRD